MKQRAATCPKCSTKSSPKKSQRMHKLNFCQSGFRCIKAMGILSISILILLPGPILAAPPGKGIGINLHGVYYWAPTLPFVDVFKQAGEWIPQREGSPTWNTGERLDLDENSWVRTLSPGQQAASVVMTGGKYPAGRYSVSYDGRGELFFGLDANIVSKRSNDLVVEVKPKNSVILKVMKTDPTDPIRNIRMTLPGFGSEDRASIFNPVYLNYLRGFKVIRFMDWANANRSDVIQWEDRTRTSHASHDRKAGVALEYMLQMAEELGADPWLTVPHAANDDYVRQMAELIKARMRPGKKFYIEYSNEVWNTQFPQHTYAAREATRLGLRDADDFYVRRSLKIFKLFEDVFGGSERFVRVLGGQAVNTFRGKRLLDYPDIGKQVDAYAIAPYFGHELLGGGLDSTRAPTEALMARLGVNVNETREIIRANVAMSREAGVHLIAYEAGQHVTNPPGQDGFCAVINRHPLMGDMYKKYLGIWEQETGGALLVLFADMSSYGRSGCWGLSEYHGQPENEAPKLKAVREFMRGSKNELKNP